MARFSVAEEEREGERLWALHDAETGAIARIWPGFGNNVVDAWLPAPSGTSARSPGGGRGGGSSGRAVHALLGPERLEQVREQPSWWGIPLLYPWASGIPQGKFRFRGREYDLNGYDAN